ncbi:hypothetical protein BT69DRAFT_1348618 [Atractiella rhizophila]|nr:hypothetical protein BT69DRAFT_1348618 [Atractiella rhizophila]
MLQSSRTGLRSATCTANPPIPVVLRPKRRNISRSSTLLTPDLLPSAPLSDVSHAPPPIIMSTPQTSLRPHRRQTRVLPPLARKNLLTKSDLRDFAFSKTRPLESFILQSTTSVGSTSARREEAFASLVQSSSERSSPSQRTPPNHLRRTGDNTGLRSTHASPTSNPIGTSSTSFPPRGVSTYGDSHSKNSLSGLNVGGSSSLSPSAEQGPRSDDALISSNDIPTTRSFKDYWKNRLQVNRYEDAFASLSQSTPKLSKPSQTECPPIILTSGPGSRTSSRPPLRSSSSRTDIPPRLLKEEPKVGGFENPVHTNEDSQRAERQKEALATIVKSAVKRPRPSPLVPPPTTSTSSLPSKLPISNPSTNSDSLTPPSIPLPHSDPEAGEGEVAFVYRPPSRSQSSRFVDTRPKTTKEFQDALKAIESSSHASTFDPSDRLYRDLRKYLQNYVTHLLDGGYAREAVDIDATFFGPISSSSPAFPNIRLKRDPAFWATALKALCEANSPEYKRRHFPSELSNREIALPISFPEFEMALRRVAADGVITNEWFLKFLMATIKSIISEIQRVVYSPAPSEVRELVREEQLTPYEELLNNLQNRFSEVKRKVHEHRRVRQHKSWLRSFSKAQFERKALPWDKTVRRTTSRPERPVTT